MLHLGKEALVFAKWFAQYLFLFFFFKKILYTFFKKDSKLKTIGEFYGMPSKVALTGGLIGSYLLDEAPYWPLGSQIFGLVYIIWVSASQVNLGFNSVGQVIAGSMLGILLHFYSTRVPQVLVFIEALIEIIFGITALSINSLKFQPNDSYNLNASITWGIGIEVFTCMMLFRHFHKTHGLSYLKLSFTKLKALENLEQQEEKDFLISENPQVRGTLTQISDGYFTAFCFLILAISFFVSESIMTYNWFS